MTILCDVDLHSAYSVLVPDEKDRDLALINPASIDVRIGRTIIPEEQGLIHLELGESYTARPGAFILVSLLERICMPNGFVGELMLKSSMARCGWDHLLAGHVDPGYDGILTMEVKNALQFGLLKLTCGARFAQLVIHRASGLSLRPYAGRYQGAKVAQGPKP